MATTILSDCYVSIDTVEYSNVISNVAISMSAEAHNITAMGEGTKKNAGGLKEWSLALEMWGDESVTGALFPKLGQEVAIEIRPTSAVVSATNPSYEGDGIVTELTPLKGAVGEPNGISMTIISASDLVRQVA